MQAYFKLSFYNKCVIFLLFLLTIFLIRQLRDPKVGFLEPSLTGQWLLAPTFLQDLNIIHARAAVFKKEIYLPEDRSLINKSMITITAANSFEFYINDTKVSSSCESHINRNWRYAQEYEIQKLLKAGNNKLIIMVYSTRRSPALLVSGYIFFGGDKGIRLDSNASWQVSIDGGKAWTSPEAMVVLRNYYQDHLNFFYKHPKLFQILKGLTALLALFIIYLAWYTYKYEPSAIRGDLTNYAFWPSSLRRLARIKPLKWSFPTLVATVVYMSLVITRDPYTGFDATGHIDYVKYVAQHWKIPLAEQGWQFYQPPAYYFFAALFYKAALPIWAYLAKLLPRYTADFLAVKTVQALTPLLVLIQTILIRKMLSEFFHKDSAPFLIASLFLLFLPMQIYMSQFITNEIFSCLTISLAFYCLIKVRKENYGFKHSLLLGLALSLAFLSKYTGLLIILTTLYTYIVALRAEKDKRRRILVSLLLITCMSLMITGPYYLRNYKHYGTPFPIPQDLEIGMDFTGEYRGLRFLIGLQDIGLGALDKYVSRTVSLMDGSYAGMWLDNTHRMFPWTRVFDFIIYYLAIFPTFLIFVGFCRVIANCNTDSDRSLKYFPFVVYTFLSLFSYLYFVIRYFDFEIVRPFYMLSQISCLTIFLAFGLEKIAGNTAKLRVFTRILLFLYLAIVSYYLLVPIRIGGSI